MIRAAVVVAVLLSVPVGLSQLTDMERRMLELQPDRKAVAEAQRRELKRQEVEVRRAWNEYSRLMNGVISELVNDGKVDLVLYRKALKAWDDLQRCTAWPYRGITK